MHASMHKVHTRNTYTHIHTYRHPHSADDENGERIARGFDRLAQSGFSEQEIEFLRAQFHSRRFSMSPDEVCVCVCGVCVCVCVCLWGVCVCVCVRVCVCVCV